MDDIIFGKNSVTEALLSGKREINKILISKNIHNDSKIDRIKELAVEKGIVFQFCTKEKFSQYAEFNHQGVIAFVSPIKYADLDEFLDKPHTNSSLVILDGIEDPHNFGAIIRSVSRQSRCYYYTFKTERSGKFSCRKNKRRCG